MAANWREKYYPSTKIAPAPTSEDIHSDVDVFLAKGGRIDRVAAGVSGVMQKPPRGGRSSSWRKKRG